MLKLSDIRLPMNAGAEQLRAEAAKMLGLDVSAILSLEILREAVDARHKSAIKMAYVVAVEVADEEAALKTAPSNKADRYEPPVYSLPCPGGKKLSARPVVVGAGPAGIFAAWVLARAGYRPIVLERGQEMDKRTQDVQAFFKGGELNPQSNVQFGEGGAGAFSDGKLVTRIKDSRCPEVLKLMVKHGAPQEILYSARAHVGTDNLWKIIPAIRAEIEALGGEYRFGWTMRDAVVADGKLTAFVNTDGEQLDAQAAVLAIGHSARDTLELLLKGGMALEQKPFAVGFRVEHPQKLINKAVFGMNANKMGASDYHVSAQINGRPVYSFCMCPGGSVINASSELGRLTVNGMSLYTRSGGNANSAIVAGIAPGDLGQGPLAGIEFQRTLEEAAYKLGRGWSAPAQRLEDYLAGRPSKAFGAVKPTVRPPAMLADLNSILPKVVNDAIKAAFRPFDTQLPGFALYDAVLTGVESRTSSPVRMVRGEDMQSQTISGLYPAGEGAGYAGGIMSSAVDGMKAAEALISQWRVEE